MKVGQLNFYGDHNLGLYGKACDKFCIIGNIEEKNIDQIKKLLNAECIRTTISNTDFIGILAVFNENGILLPKIANSNEIEFFSKIGKQFGLNCEILESKFTAIGNLILCNSKGAVISKLFGRNEKKKIEECLGVESCYENVAGMKTVGSAGVATNKGCLLHRDAEEKEIEQIKSILKVEVGIGTVNFGSPFVGSAIIANSNGAIIGESSTGPEVVRIQETLGFF